MVALREAGLDDRERLWMLLAQYLFEFDGRTEPYPDFNAYRREPGRLPFLIEADGEAVGLCLIRVRDDGWSIAEFWVVPEHRRAGTGRAAVQAVAGSPVPRAPRILRRRSASTTARRCRSGLPSGFARSRLRASS